MNALVSVILPVFIVMGCGYFMVWRGFISDSAVDGLMQFAQGFAIPCLLFTAISTLDLRQEFDAALLVTFYSGALVAFCVGIIGARLFFGRSWEDSIAVGFVALFSNSVMLGLPITERAYGAGALAGNYAIVAIHAPFCYAVGVITMELVRARGHSLWHIPGRVGRAIFGNALVIGIVLGFVVNLTGLPLPTVLTDAIDLVVRAALPAALFGLGGILYRYRPEGDIRTILFITGVSLMVHPAVVWIIGQQVGLSDAAFRSAVITAAAAPGVNAYLFADMYGAARRVSASAVLFGTLACIISASFWISLLP